MNSTDTPYSAGLRRRVTLARMDRDAPPDRTFGRIKVSTIERDLVPVTMCVAFELSVAYDVSIIDLLCGWDGWQHDAKPPRANRRVATGVDVFASRLSRRLLRLRQDAGWSQAKAAQIMGRSQSMYSRYETASGDFVDSRNSHWSPTVDEMRTMINALNLDWRAFVETLRRD